MKNGVEKRWVLDDSLNNMFSVVEVLLRMSFHRLFVYLKRHSINSRS